MARRDPSRSVAGELALIEAIRRQAGVGGAGSGALRLGMGDDCAILAPKADDEVCVTTDFTLEGVHFRRDWHPPESVGHRCLARGLSDLAAMGAEPMAVFLSLAVPGPLPARWLERFLNGFLALAKKHRVPLAGGDTAQSPQISRSRDGLILADIVAIGHVPRGKALLRSGARAGDLIYVTGALGGAAAELAALEKNSKRLSKMIGNAANHPHFYPKPRLGVGRRLRALAHAMIDLSDGLSTDLRHLCEESHVAAVLDQAALPIHPLAAQDPDSLSLALNGGEDYELLFTAAATVRIPRKWDGVPIHRIGSIFKRRRQRPLITLQTTEGKGLLVEPGGWEYFRSTNSGSRRSKR